MAIIPSTGGVYVRMCICMHACITYARKYVVMYVRTYNLFIYLQNIITTNL